MKPILQIFTWVTENTEFKQVSYKLKHLDKS